IGAYGAWGEKTVNGQVREGILRISYLIDPHGLIAQSWQVEDPESHARDVREALKRHASGVTA
ncbi:MAG TPA: hypothetical protein VFD39_06575, partial [Trueperaceae bacterium]|nr:hypothetical protein [Trueperaceae bacterium]